jgi:hypothetical protein
MHRTLAILSFLVAIFSVVGATGCSSSSPAASGGCGSATVSFSADVMPVFQRGCTLSSVCHGQMDNAAEENLYLGMNAGGGGSADANAVYTGLVGVAAQEDPSMNLVTKGDPSTSFLFQKLSSASLMSLASDCSKAATKCNPDCNASTPCGGQMPYLGEALNSTDACTLQNWISQGAPNN